VGQEKKSADVSQEELCSDGVLASKDDESGSRPRKKRTFVNVVLGFACVVTFFTIAVLAAVAYIISQPLPDISIDAIERRSSRPSTLFAADGTVLAQWHGDLERQPMEAEDFPQVIFDATVAIEDQRFFDHSGLDLRGIIRAFQRNYQAGEIEEGGSTITQQLMKMMYVGEDQTFIRKVEEAILATRVEMEYDKRDILAAYLNMAFFGQGAYGLAAASEIFFDVEPQDLTIAQAATLAGVLHMPSAYRPHDDLEPLQQRRDVVLEAMREQGLITQVSYNEAIDTPLEVEPRMTPASDVQSPFFVDFVARDLHNYIDDERIAQGGLNIFTTLDPVVQQAAEDAADTFNGRSSGPTVSMVTMRHSDGAILALVGGKDWDDNEFNIAVQARRQPGSAFKPLTLIAALEAGYDIDQEVDATPYEVVVKDELWQVNNYANADYGDSVTLREATIRSVNTVYARTIIDIGPERVVQLAHDMGFTADMEPDPALALGGLRYGVSPLEMAHAYTTIARAGEDIAPRSVYRITSATNPNEVLYQATDQVSARVFPEEVGREVRSTLRSAITQGTGRNANISGLSVSGKTGTAQNYHDAWFVGWADGVTTAVWMGHPEAQIEMRDVRGRDVTGGSFPAEIWRDFTEAAIEARPGSGLTDAPFAGRQNRSDDEQRTIPTLEEIGRAP